MSETAEPERRSIADRLDHLFKTFRRPDGREYSHREVERELATRYDLQLSHAYIGDLRVGRHDNPTVKALKALGTFFGVPVEYFTQDDVAHKVDQELQLAVALRELRNNGDLQTLVVRARGLSAKSLHAITEIIDDIRKIQDPPPVQTPDPPPPDEPNDRRM